MTPANRKNSSSRKTPSSKTSSGSKASSGKKTSARANAGRGTSSGRSTSSRNPSGSRNPSSGRGATRSRARTSARTRGSSREPRGRGWLSVVGPRRGALLVLTAVTALVLALYFTPLLGVRSVRVEGNRMLGEQEVLAAAEVPLGESMLRVDTDAIRSRLGQNPKVASARVELSWPSTVRLDVAERTPEAFVRTGDAVRLVDADGVPFASAPQPPPGMPELRAPAPNDPLVRAEVSALASLPPQLRGQVVAVTARTPGDLRLRLTGDREVRWGSLRDSERKAAVLPLLLTQPGTVYNVTSPELPTVA